MSSQLLPRAARLPRWLVLMGLLTAIGPLSIDMYLPAFPAIGEALEAESGAVQLSLAAFFIGLAIGQLIYGPISDRFGRKPPLYVGLALFIATSVACAFATSMPVLIGFRLLQGLAGAVGPVVARAVVRDRCDATAAARALSMLVLVMGLAPVLAPLLGGWVVAWSSWRTIFVLLALVGAALLWGVHAWMTETHRPAAPPPLRLGSTLRNYGELLRDRPFMAYLVAGGLTQAGLFAYISASPFVFIELYGLTPPQFGWVFALNAAGLIAASQINARLVVRSSPAANLRWSTWMPLVVSVAAVALALFDLLTLAPLIIALFFYLAFFSFVVPNTTALALATQGPRAGTASALLGGLQFGFATFAALVMGLWHDNTALPMLIVMALCAIGSRLAYRTVADRYVVAP